MDQLEIIDVALVCSVKEGKVGNGKFPEPLLISENVQIMDTTADTFEMLEILQTYEKDRDVEAIAKIALYKITFESNDETCVPQSNDPLVRAYYLFNKGRKLRSNELYQDAVRCLEAAKAIECDCVPLHAMVDRELAACYATLGWYGKCAELASELLEIIKLNGDYTFKGSVAKCYPVPSCQGDETSCAGSWEKDLFASNNSRAQSCYMSSDGQMLAARDFRVGEVVFIERPIVGYVAETKGQCNVCTLKTLHTIPCADCSAVFYCSVHCREQDFHFHKHECNGYKILFFPLLNGVLPLRMLVRALDIMMHELVAHRKEQYPKNVQQLWNALLRGCNNFPDFRVMLDHAYDYGALPKCDFLAQLVKSKTLNCYIAANCSLLHDYKLCWTNVSEKQRETFVLSLLLRFSALTMLKSACFTYELSYKLGEASIMKESIPSESTSSIPPSLVAFDEVFFENEQFTELSSPLVKRLLEKALVEIRAMQHSDMDSASPPGTTEEEGGSYTIVESARCRATLKSFWDSCVQDVAHGLHEWSGLDEFTRQQGLVKAALREYCENYASRYEQHSAHLAETKRTTNQYYGMYRFSVELRQSSAPNTVAVLLNDGAVAFRATKTISKGEIITYAVNKFGKFEGWRTDQQPQSLRCSECRFQLVPPAADLCPCESYDVGSSREIRFLLHHIQVLEYNIAHFKTKRHKAHQVLGSLCLLRKLWKSIFLSENNIYSLTNMVHEFRVWAISGVRGYFDILSICTLFASFSTTVEYTIPQSFELYYRMTHRTIQYITLTMEQYVIGFLKNGCYASFFVIFFRIIDMLLATCKQATCVTEGYMQHAYLLELFTSMTVLRKLRQQILCEFSVWRLADLQSERKGNKRKRNPLLLVLKQ